MLRVRPEISINHQDVLQADLENTLRTIYSERRDKTLYISGAPTLAYKRIIEVMDAARGQVFSAWA